MFFISVPCFVDTKFRNISQADKNQQNNGKHWVSPPHSNSDHQDYTRRTAGPRVAFLASCKLRTCKRGITFLVGNPYKPSCEGATLKVNIIRFGRAHLKNSPRFGIFSSTRHPSRNLPSCGNSTIMTSTEKKKENRKKRKTQQWGKVPETRRNKKRTKKKTKKN